MDEPVYNFPIHLDMEDGRDPRVLQAELEKLHGHPIVFALMPRADCAVCMKNLSPDMADRIRGATAR